MSARDDHSSTCNPSSCPTCWERAETMQRPIVSLSRPADGRIMCCICFRLREVADLAVDPTDGKRWDVCGDGTCAAEAGIVDEEVTG